MRRKYSMIEEWIKEMEDRIDSHDFEEIQEDVIYKIQSANLGRDAIEPLLRFMERHPLTNFGMPGAIVHYVEQFYKKGYEDLLIASIQRRPTLHTVWMVNRIKNTGENSDRYIDILTAILEKQAIEEEIKTSIRGFLSQ